MQPMIATSSSLYNEDWVTMNALNGLDPGQYSDYDDMFNSGNDNYPWLAIDLGFLYKVFFLYKLLKLTIFGCVNV